MFRQNADGLMDCSVWAIQSEFEETTSPGGGVLMTHRQVWRPVRFGPLQARTGLARLIEAEKITWTGKARGTKYEAL